ncbi:MAG TPA: M67 family metallopeptidase [Actinomycetota bacterium]|nr:M67 family metallopeptidase [Actinomycetota bacterium]
MIEIPSAVRDAMVAHALDGLPNEACGLLAGSDGRVEHFFPMANADRSALTYTLDPKEHLRVEDEIWDKGWSVVGIFHSHTTSQAYPSPTDTSKAGGYPDAAYMILSLADRSNPSLRAFTIRRGEVEEEEVKIL